ncbi:MAG TPA: methylenetetrahydrofolate--tRNA-(uracil(54)-C(5))-methyltransferase (FADH(2)-oxidizing) TrmFO [Anaerolineae bacterium]
MKQATDGDHEEIIVIGGGLAGSEAAWQAAQQGLHVTIYEMRPVRMTPAHETGRMAELVCSNSMGSNLPDHALGLLKNEMRSLGSLIIACADRCAVPAGSALAVGREEFSQAVTEAIAGHPGITVRREEITDIPNGVPVVVATGPLTSPTLSAALRELAGQDYLYFFDAMAPIVTGDSIDMTIAYRASRWQKPTAGVQLRRADPSGDSGAEGAIVIRQRSVVDAGEAEAGDYINCPLTQEQYYAFVEAVNRAEKISLHQFEADPAAQRYFEACLPIDVLAGRGVEAMAYGPMRPVGLRDPRTGRWPYAVVQLRQDNVAGTLYNLVGFQTNMKWGDQERVLRLIPALENAEFVRFGQMHRNTFINSPALLRPTLQWHCRDDLFFAGQITGTEGYVGSAAGGLLAGTNAARVARGQTPITLPTTTMMGGLFHYITHCEPAAFQPMKANFGLLPPLPERVPSKRERGAQLAARATADLAQALAGAY